MFHYEWSLAQISVSIQVIKTDYHSAPSSSSTTTTTVTTTTTTTAATTTTTTTTVTTTVTAVDKTDHIFHSGWSLAQIPVLFPK